MESLRYANVPCVSSVTFCQLIFHLISLQHAVVTNFICKLAFPKFYNFDLKLKSSIPFTKHHSSKKKSLSFLPFIFHSAGSIIKKKHSSQESQKFQKYLKVKVFQKKFKNFQTFQRFKKFRKSEIQKS